MESIFLFADNTMYKIMVAVIIFVFIVIPLINKILSICVNNREIAEGQESLRKHQPSEEEQNQEIKKRRKEKFGVDE